MALNCGLPKAALAPVLGGLGRFSRYALVLAAIQVAAPPAYGGDWPSLGLDLARSRRSTEQSGATFGAGGWLYRVPAPKNDVKIDIAASPAVAEGFVVFATLEGTVRALRAIDGKELWHFSAKDGIVASPAIARGRVFVGSFDRTLYALNLSDGKVVWSREGVGISYASPAPVADEKGEGLLLVTGFPERKVIRFDAATGKTVWQTSEGTLVRSGHAAVAVGGGRAVVGTVGGRYHAFDVQTGNSAWTYEAQGIVHLAAPVIANNTVFFAPGGDNAQLHAVDLATGQAREGWPVTIVGPTPSNGKSLDRNHVVSSPIIAAQQLYLLVRFADFIDTNNDGAPDRWDLREVLAGFDLANAKPSHQVELARASSTTPDVIPSLGVLPTPAVYLDAGGVNELLAVASSLTPNLKIIRPATGAVMWNKELAAPTRGSPVMANGMLFMGSDHGSLFALNSDFNQAPRASDVSPDVRQTITPLFSKLKWGQALDLDGDATSYVVRIDRDGEVLTNWLWELTTAPGVAEIQVPEGLKAGEHYEFAVRARDKSGALSGWSAMAAFDVAEAQTVTVSGQPVVSLAQALGKARPGEVVTLGKGRFTLDATATVPAGVTLQGAGAGLTTIDARNLPFGLVVKGTSQSLGRIGQITVAGADIGIDIPAGQTVEIDHVVVRDAHTTGLRVGTNTDAQVLHGTFVRNGTGISSLGTTQVRNSLVVFNAVGLATVDAGSIASSFNNVVDNNEDVSGSVKASSDIALAVQFVDQKQDDFHVVTGLTTDKGDPAADFSQEPAPNGGRVNLGAYGNTVDAELSTAETAPTSQPSVGPGTAGEVPNVKERRRTGCAVGGQGAPGVWSLSLLALLAARGVRRRRSLK